MADRLWTRSNYRKHTSTNPLQRWLLARFHERVAEMVGATLGPPQRRLGQGDPAPTNEATGQAIPGAGQAVRWVLDVGCGEGFVASFLLSALPGLRLVGLDLDYGAVGAVWREKGRFVGGNALALPFADCSFDLTLGLEVLEHLEDPQAALAELARVSRGPLLLSVPHQPFFSLANLLRGKNLPQRGDDPEHRQHWSPGRFLAFLERSVNIQRVAYSFPWLIALGQRKVG